MERTLRLLQERFFWPKMAEDVRTHIHTCERYLRFKQPQERAEMQPILVSYPMELIHLDFLTLGGKTGDTKSTNILVVTDHFAKYAQAYMTGRRGENVPGISMFPITVEFLYFSGEILHYSITMMSLCYIANDVISLS